jgi:CBS domain containing-hemolysin-like protein
MDPVTGILIMLLCLALEAFFSGSEIGVVSADRAKLLHAAENGSRGARLALQMLQKPEWLLSTTLVGTNLAIVTNTTVATIVVVGVFGEEYGWLAALIVAPLTWVFGEIVAKSAFQQNADVITPRIIPFIKFASYVFYPLLIAFAFLTRSMARLSGKDESNVFTIREEITSLMQVQSTHGDIDPEEQNMIRRVFEFGETAVTEVFIPLIDVVGVPSVATCEEAIRIGTESSHRHLPVYEERVDYIVGVLDTLRLIGVSPDEPIDAYISPVRFVPSTQSIENLLLDMRMSMQSMAVVVDEYGGADGVVTIEDLLEEVVGEIVDEHDDAEPHQFIDRIDRRNLLVNARIAIDDLFNATGIELPQGNYETLGGFLADLAQYIPQPGTELQYRKFNFTIEEASQQAVQQVRITW